MLALGDCVHAGLSDADSGPLGSEGHMVSMPWQITDKESELALHSTPATSDCVWPAFRSKIMYERKKFHTFKLLFLHKRWSIRNILLYENFLLYSK